jgi:hypothetical protein
MEDREEFSTHPQSSPTLTSQTEILTIKENQTNIPDEHKFNDPFIVKISV